MNTETVRKLLMGIRQGKISVDDALDRLRNFPVDASEFVVDYGTDDLTVKDAVYTGSTGIVTVTTYTPQTIH